MLLALLISVFLISRDLGLGFTNIIPFIAESEYSKIFFWEGDQHFLKRFFTGAFIAIVMTGLDQDMMQKILAAKTLVKLKKYALFQHKFDFCKSDVFMSGSVTVHCCW